MNTITSNPQRFPLITKTAALALAFLPLLFPAAHAQAVAPGASADTAPEAAAPGVVRLPAFAVYSPRGALQEPAAGSFAMPVSALAFEPLVDAQARNMGEAQADIAIRGGIFENTGIRAGAAALYDPQTGHYTAEIPIAPAMLSAPEIITGAINAARGWNAGAGTVTYDWRRITTTGFATAAAGGNSTVRGELYQGWQAPDNVRVLGRRLAFDASAAWSRSDGSRPWGESRFSRYNVRAQLANDSGRTDLFYGRQSKFFGWPNLYTPYASVFETDDLQTEIVSLNHRENLGANGDYVAFGGAWRRNKDYYVFNRADPGAYNPAFATGPARHTTHVWSAGAEARVSTAQIHWNASVNFIADKLKSTSLNHGRFNSRSHVKVSLVPERTWRLGSGETDAPTLTAQAGAAFDDTNRDSSAWSPIAALTLGNVSKMLGIETLYVSYAGSSQVPTYTALNNAPRGLFAGNANLGREDSRNFEIGARGAWGAWSAAAAVFYREDDDLVDWVYSFAAPNARVANAVDICTPGFELTARFSAAWGDLVFGYTALGKDADYDSANAAGITQIDASFYALNYARHRVTAAVIARPWRSWEIRLDNEARWQRENALRKSGDTALLTSAGVFFSPESWRGLRLFAQITNAWDSDFEDVPAVPAAGREWSVGAMMSW